MLFGAAERAWIRRAEELLARLTRPHPLLTVEAVRHEFRGFGPWAKRLRLRRDLFTFIAEEATRRRASTCPGDDGLGFFVQARREDGSVLSNDELCDQLMGDGGPRD